MIVMIDSVPNMNLYNESGLGPNCYAQDLYYPNDGTWSENRAKDCAMFYGLIAAQNEVELYIIGLGNGIDALFLETLATVFGWYNGQFYAAASPAQLDDIFDAILQGIR